MDIILSQITKSYHHKLIFNNISYHFQSGKRYGIAGHNGSGKSTLLKMIAGYISPTSGTIVYSRDRQSIPVENIYKEISFAAPYLDIPLDMNLNELFDFHFSIKKRVEGLTNLQINQYFKLPIELPIYQFSSGMIQRVKLALAFFTECSILILDEPTETLDEKGFHLYSDLLSQYSTNKTVLIASNKTKDFIDCVDSLDITHYSE